jgi:4-phosphopantoate--beta-alanine ligase
MSRTARAADLTLVDNIVRALPLMIDAVRGLSRKSRTELRKIVEGFDNGANLAAALKAMRQRLKQG